MGGPAPLVPSAVDLAATARIQGLNPSPQKERITKAAQNFEGMLMEQLMQGLRKTVESGGLFGQEGQSKSTFEYLMDQAVIAKAVKGGRGLGLAAQMERIWENRSGDLGNSKALPIGLESR